VSPAAVCEAVVYALVYGSVLGLFLLAVAAARGRG